jgi:serine/threonine-protein kinase
VKTTPKPTVVPGLSGVIAISIGTNHRCALSGQTTYCWGANDNGQLGDGTTNPSTTPIVPQGIPALQSIAAGAGATCGLTPTGDSWCWGATGKSMGTVVITNPGAKLAAADQATAIAVGLENFYGVVAGGIDAWGGDAFGQLGNGMPSGLWTNAPGFFVAGTYVTVATAGYTVCSVDAAGSVWCWGAGAQGQCGGSFAKMVEAPNKVDGVAGASQVVVGSNHACALAAGEVWCWGSNAGGQLGVSGGNTATPVKVAIPGAVTAIAAGSAHTCALAGGRYGAGGPTPRVSWAKVTCSERRRLRPSSGNRRPRLVIGLGRV